MIIITLSVVCAFMMIGRATAVYYVCQLGSEIREIKNPRKFCCSFFGANLQNIVPTKISTYTVHYSLV